MRFRLAIDAPRFFSIVELPTKARILIGRWPEEKTLDPADYYRLLPAARFAAQDAIDYLRANSQRADYFLFVDAGALDISRQHLLIECTTKGCWATDISRYGTRLSRANAPLARVRLERDVRTPLALHDQLELPARLSPGKVETLEAVKLRLEERPRQVVLSSPFEELAPLVKAPSALDTEPPLLALLPRHSRYLIRYLPQIYQPPPAHRSNGVSSDSRIYDAPENFFARYLALFESILLPLEWSAKNFDLFLTPATTPATFLPWLAQWFGLHFDDSWSEEKQRRLLAEAYLLYARRGTAWALQRLLELYREEFVATLPLTYLADVEKGQLSVACLAELQEHGVLFAQPTNINIFCESPGQRWRLTGAEQEKIVRLVKRNALLHVYSHPPVDIAEDIAGQTFVVKVRAPETARAQLMALINSHKPAHTAYRLILET